jgi:hypothetical protein
MESYQLCKEYLDLVAAYPSHARMVKGHVHKLLRGWLSEFTDIRERIQRDASGGDLTILCSLVSACGCVCWAAAVGSSCMGGGTRRRWLCWLVLAAATAGSAGLLDCRIAQAGGLIVRPSHAPDTMVPCLTPAQPS